MMNIHFIRGIISACLCLTSLVPYGLSDAKILSPLLGTSDMIRHDKIDQNFNLNPILAKQLGIDYQLDRIAASLQTYQKLSPSQLQRLKQLGVQFYHRSSMNISSKLTVADVMSSRNIFPVYLAHEKLKSIAQLPFIKRIESDWRLIQKPTYEVESLIHAQATHLRPKDGVSGKGVTVASIDNGVNVLHPQFFHADAGEFIWIDVEGNGQLDPGVDGIDMNANGQLDPEEVLYTLDGIRINLNRQGFETSNHDQVYQPQKDWLYMDLDGSGQRNAGIFHGFTEQDLTYGEPLFLAEDFDQNEIITDGEWIYQLGSSKIKFHWIDDQVYERGRNLIESEDALYPDRGDHGTPVASIVLGGHLAHELRGVAPDAELITYSTRGDYNTEELTRSMEGTVAAVIHAQEQGASALIHEWSDPSSSFDDGSTHLEMVIDQAHEDGCAQVCPTGNMNIAKKQAHVIADEQGEVKLNFRIGRQFNQVNYQQFMIRILVLQPSMPEMQIYTPSQELFSPQLNNQRFYLSDTVYGISSRQISARTTQEIKLLVYSEEPLESGEWELHISNFRANEIVYVRIDDLISGWSTGIHWVDEVSSEGSLTYPSTSDLCIGVGAVGGVMTFDYPLSEFWNDGSGPGDLRSYSGIGPRLDGLTKVDLVSTDDPLAADHPVSPNGTRPSSVINQFRSFGGTSGASPFVLGALALLSEVDPQASSEARKQKLIEGVERDQLELGEQYYNVAGDLVSNEWGYGRLNVYQSVFNESSRDERDEIQILDVTIRWDDMSTGRILISVDSMVSDMQDLYWRLDVNANLSWEYEWQSDAMFSVSVDDLDIIEQEATDQILYRVNIEVRDQWGSKTATIHHFELPEMIEIENPNEMEPNHESDHNGGAEMDDMIMLVNEMNESGKNPTSVSQCMSVSHIQQQGWITQAWVVVLLVLLSLYKRFVSFHVKNPCRISEKSFR